MSIECYFKQCPHHSIHTGPNDGPICDMPDCVASAEDTQKWQKERDAELQLGICKDPVLCSMIQLELQTGVKRVVNTTPPLGYTIQLYFECINSLNQQAHIYGVVYLATSEAIDALLKTNVPH